VLALSETGLTFAETYPQSGPARSPWTRPAIAQHRARVALSEAAEALEPGGRPLTREEVLVAYRPIRAAVRRVLREAVRTCSRADLTRAAKQLGLWDEGRIVADEDATEMLADVALFEPNQRGRRAFDRFLDAEARRLAPADLEVARRMAGAFFSIFRLAARHEAAGVRLEDLLEADRQLWLVDEGLETSAPDGLVFGMRLFDAGPFHAGFGIVAPADQETVEFAVEARARGARSPFRHSLAATLYGDGLRAGTADERVLDALLEVLPSGLVLPDDGRPAERSPRPSSKRKQ
jgi:hypothetical protein